MSSVVEYGRRRGSSKRGSLAVDACRMTEPPHLGQVTVLSKAEWLRVQDKVNGLNKDEQSLKEAAKQKEALHLQSKEMVKQWPNTIAAQRQKRLKAKKIRDDIEEEKWKRIAEEEAKYQEEMQKKAIEKARTQQYNQTHQVRELHSAVLLTEVLKERAAQIELKQKIKNASENTNKAKTEAERRIEEGALREIEEKDLQKKLERLATAEKLKEQMKEHERVREQKMIEDQKEEERIQRHIELCQLEKRMEEERRAKNKRELAQAHLDCLRTRDAIRMVEIQKQEERDTKNKLYISEKVKTLKLRKEREAQLLRDGQVNRERVRDMLTTMVQEQTHSEEEEDMRIAKVVAVRKVKQEQQQKEKQEKQGEMLKSIAAHRELKRQEKEQRNKMEEQKRRDEFQSMKEADRIFSEKQKLGAQRSREDKKQLQDFYAAQMAEKYSREQQLRRQDLDSEMNAGLQQDEENQFQMYSEKLLKAAIEAQRPLYPLSQTIRKLTCRDIKMNNKDVCVQNTKKRLGLLW